MPVSLTICLGNSQYIEIYVLYSSVTTKLLVLIQLICIISSLSLLNPVVSMSRNTIFSEPSPMISSYFRVFASCPQAPAIFLPLDVLQTTFKHEEFRELIKFCLLWLSTFLNSRFGTSL